MKNNSAGNAVYGLGMIGVLVYFMQQANDVKDVLFGIFKSVIWPAILTYRLFEFMKM